MRRYGVMSVKPAAGKRTGHVAGSPEARSAIEGVEEILLSATTAQDAAASLYRSLGFESYGCERRALKIGDGYVDEGTWSCSSSQMGRAGGD